MCGICGIISLKPKLLNRSDIKRMTEMIRHRGPDNTGYFFSRNVQFGNPRLKIIDLNDRSNLPFSTKDSVLCYSGEISNFLELKKKHLSNIKFLTDSDSEVLVRGYEKFGQQFFNMLNGMFSFSLYDKKNKKIFIVRDFFGIKPLFYSFTDNTIHFSSEIKALMQMETASKKINTQGLSHYLSLGYYPLEHTPYEQIKELLPGNMIEINLHDQTHKMKRYYSLKFNSDNSMTRHQAINGFQKLFTNSIGRNLISDVPMGLTLSGGIDSSGILGVVSKKFKKQNFHTFSLRIRSKSFDESKYQRYSSRFANSNHHEIQITHHDIEKYLTEHMNYLDEPISDGSSIPMYKLGKVAKKYVKVLLSGEGGDEISSAYETHIAHKVAEYFSKMPLSMRQGLAELSKTLPTSFSKLSLDFKIKRFIKGTLYKPSDRHLFFRHVLTTEEINTFLIDEKIAQTEKLYRSFFNESMGTTLNKISDIDLACFFVGDLMLKNDRMLAAHSIEGRFPFMDRELVEFCARVPDKWKIYFFKRRYFEKEALKKYLHPKVYSRGNFGIEIPYSSMLNNELRHLVEKYLSKKRIEGTNLFRYEFLNKKIKNHRSKKEDNGRFLWTMINFMVWAETNNLF